MMQREPPTDEARYNAPMANPYQPPRAVNATASRIAWASIARAALWVVLVVLASVALLLMALLTFVYYLFSLL